MALVDSSESDAKSPPLGWLCNTLSITANAEAKKGRSYRRVKSDK